MFKTWTRDGTPRSYHRTAVLNRAAAMGRAAYDAAASVIEARQAGCEKVSGVTANMAMDAAKAAA